MQKVKDVIDNISRFELIRYNFSTDEPISLGAKIIEKTVKEREQDLINRVNQAINKELSRADEDLYSEFVERFMDRMYYGFDISFKKGEVK
ncbi:MAG: hypothetical protein EOL93_13595 [Epsilonproteobacteria bacterium]|nr:hypothetical protein [Campylobacterota bacterium]